MDKENAVSNTLSDTSVGVDVNIVADPITPIARSDDLSNVMVHLPLSSSSRTITLDAEDSQALRVRFPCVSDASYVPPNQLACSTPQPHFVEQQPHKRYRGEEESGSNVTLRGATLVGSPPGSLAIRITSAIGRAGFSCPTSEMSKNGESGFFPHDFAWEAPDLEVDSDPLPEVMGADRFISVKELATSSSILWTVPLEKIISFVLNVRDTDNLIYIPSTHTFDLIINMMEAHIIMKCPALRSYSWNASRWMNCGIVDLTQDMDLLELWRTTLSEISLNDSLKADTFPRDSLLMGSDITALLKEPYLTCNIKMLNYSLMFRNNTLKGSVRVVCSKEYTAHDITRHDVNMKGLRLVYLAGDCVFMEYLSRHPLSHRFTAGPSTVLHGGIRKPAFLVDQVHRPRPLYTWINPSYSPSLSLQPMNQSKRSSSSSSSGVFVDSTMAVLTTATSASSSAPVASSSSSALVSALTSAKGKTPASKTAKARAKPKNRTTRIKAAKLSKSQTQSQI